MEGLPSSLSLHGSHVSFFWCQAHHERERGETGELFASPPPSGSGRSQPPLLGNGEEEKGWGDKVRDEGRRCARLLLMCCGVWCQVDISTTELAARSPPNSPTHPLLPFPPPMAHANQRLSKTLSKPCHKWVETSFRGVSCCWTLMSSEARWAPELQWRSASAQQQRCAAPSNMGTAVVAAPKDICHGCTAWWAFNKASINTLSFLLRDVLSVHNDIFIALHVLSCRGVSVSLHPGTKEVKRCWLF